MEKQREKFGSRLGFILISAGCAIGLGNVWKFPYITGQYGGAAFVLIYFMFLLILGIPALTAELAVGRASQRSVAMSMDVLERKGQIDEKDILFHMVRDQRFGINGVFKAVISKDEPQQLNYVDYVLIIACFCAGFMSSK